MGGVFDVARAAVAGGRMRDWIFRVGKRAIACTRGGSNSTAVVATCTAGGLRGICIRAISDERDIESTMDVGEGSLFARSVVTRDGFNLTEESVISHNEIPTGFAGVEFDARFRFDEGAVRTLPVVVV